MVVLSSCTVDDGSNNADCCLLLNSTLQSIISSCKEVPLSSPSYSEPKAAHCWNRSSDSGSLLRSVLMSSRNPKHELRSRSCLLWTSISWAKVSIDNFITLLSSSSIVRLASRAASPDILRLRLTRLSVAISHSGVLLVDSVNVLLLALLWGFGTKNQDQRLPLVDSFLGIVVASGICLFLAKIVLRKWENGQNSRSADWLRVSQLFLLYRQIQSHPHWETLEVQPVHLSWS